MSATLVFGGLSNLGENVCVKPENGIHLIPTLRVSWCFCAPLLAEAVYATSYHEFNMQIHIIMVNGD